MIATVVFSVCLISARKIVIPYSIASFALSSSIGSGIFASWHDVRCEGGYNTNQIAHKMSLHRSNFSKQSQRAGRPAGTKKAYERWLGQPDVSRKYLIIRD